MPDIPHPIVALAIGTGIVMMCLGIAVGVIVLASRHPAIFADVVPRIVERFMKRG